MPENAVPMNSAFAQEWLARELGEVLTDKREPTTVIPNRRERRAMERRARIERNRL
jgi:hypothetical protein